MKQRLRIRALQVLICACLPMVLAGCGAKAGKVPAQAIGKVTEQEEHIFTCEYGGQTREFLEYAPNLSDPINISENVTPGKDSKGIIFMLHGYGSDGRAFRNDTKMDETALKRGYVVVYVSGVSNEQDKTSATGWNSGIGTSTEDDMGFLKALAIYMQEKYELTRENTFAAGFSNGGFMMYRIAVEGEDTFVGVASVAGMMPQTMWEEKKETANISLLQINGTKDDVVPMHLNGSAKYAKAPAIEDVLEYFVTANALTQKEEVKLSEKADLTKYYEGNNGLNRQVWQVLIKDGRHSWPQEELYGFNTNELILDFFGGMITE